MRSRPPRGTRRTAKRGGVFANSVWRRSLWHVWDYPLRSAIDQRVPNCAALKRGYRRGGPRTAPARRAQRGAFLDRDLVVPAHAHRQTWPSNSNRDRNRPESSEAGRTSDEPLRQNLRDCRRSSSPGFGRLESAAISPAGFEILRQEAGLRRVAVDIDLEIDAQSFRAVDLTTEAIEPVRQFDRVDDWMTSKISTARRALFDCSGPMRCHVTPERP